MPTEILVTLWRKEKATHEEVKALLEKIYDFGTNEGYDIRDQKTSIRD